MSGKPGRRLRFEIAPTGWQDRAACTERTDLTWFPDAQGTSKSQMAAIEVCRTCPVELDCLRYAVANGENYGIWGGMTTDQRTNLRRDRRRYAALNLEEPA